MLTTGKGRFHLPELAPTLPGSRCNKMRTVLADVTNLEFAIKYINFTALIKDIYIKCYQMRQI